ncbi:hypothetical protein Pmani_006969 [Petrolisthes manimaculis]|uniref:Uncharacterized protein n=1 Tax=Petrolisthes manimaculis TaxID=1843537 RepID=A0AAE1Q9W7_9EUCA|nr:hypothetical protein Pmani_006969 [Petrolisthes manimaculis]
MSLGFINLDITIDFTWDPFKPLYSRQKKGCVDVAIETTSFVYVLLPARAVPSRLIEATIFSAARASRVALSNAAHRL